MIVAASRAAKTGAAAIKATVVIAVKRILLAYREKAGLESNKRVLDKVEI